MIYTFDYAFCHLTFLAAMLYYWSKLDHTVSSESLTFTRNFYIDPRKSQYEHAKAQKQSAEMRNNIFKTLKYYISERSQSLSTNYLIQTFVKSIS